MNKRCLLILLMLPLHLLLFWLMRGEMLGRTGLTFAVLLTVIADLALSAASAELFTSKTDRVGLFLHDALPYFGCVLLIFAADCGVYAKISRPGAGLFDTDWTDIIWLGTCLISLVLGALVTLVTGAARTMLYHDNRKGR